jgi:ubiquinone biosynthesis protein COQ4
VEIHSIDRVVYKSTSHPKESPAMLNSLHNPHTWQQSMLSSFIGIAEAEDGDFTAIDRLISASRDPHSSNLTIEHLSRFPQCQLVLANREPLGAVDLADLHQLPIDTLGYHYANYMLRHQLKHLAAPPAANEAEFIDTHMRETHDIWHVVTGSSITYGRLRQRYVGRD